MIIQLFAPTNLPFSIFSEHLRQRARPLLLYSANALYSCSSAVSIGFQCPSTTVKGGAIFALKFVHVPLLSSGGLGCQGVKKMKLNLENSRELLIGISESRMPWIASPFFFLKLVNSHTCVLFLYFSPESPDTISFRPTSILCLALI